MERNIFPALLTLLFLLLIAFSTQQDPKTPELPEELSHVEEKCLLFFYFQSIALKQRPSLREEIRKKFCQFECEQNGTISAVVGNETNWCWSDFSGFLLHISNSTVEGVANVGQAKIIPVEVTNPEMDEKSMAEEKGEDREKMFIKMTEKGAWFVFRLPNCTKSGTPAEGDAIIDAFIKRSFK